MRIGWRAHTLNATSPTSITRCGVSSFFPHNVFVRASVVDDFALAPAERALLEALNRHGIRFLIVDLSAAVLEGAPLATQDIDLWLERAEDPRIPKAAAEAGGFWVGGFGVQPPAFGGHELERLDVVLTAHGLGPFDDEYAGAIEHQIDGVPVRVLPLDRVIASKRSTGRPKDLAALPALEATLVARRDRDHA